MGELVHSVRLPACNSLQAECRIKWGSTHTFKGERSFMSTQNHVADHTEMKLRAAQRALDIYTQGVREVAHQNLEVVRQTYTLGRATLLDVIAEQRRYIDIETGYTEALKQTYNAVVDIERAVGTLEH